MRISFFVPRCTPDNSHGRYVIELARRLGVAYPVTVYSGSFWSPLRSQVDCRILPVPNSPAVARLASLWVASAVATAQRTADIVHIQGADAPVGNVITAHCCNAAMRAAASHSASRIRRCNYSVGIAAERYCMAKPSTRRVIAVSHQVKGDIERHYCVSPKRIVVIPHGVDGDCFHPRNRGRHRESVRLHHGIGAREFVVAFVGRDYQLKGLPVLLEAVAHVRMPITVLAVGVDPRAVPQEVLCHDGVGSRVVCVGVVADVAPFYAAADCFVLPTGYDTFSLATLEAMASGLPVIVSRAAGVSEHLRDGVDALVLQDASDVNTLAAHLRLLADDQASRAQLGSAGRETAERFSWERVADRTLEVYGEALGDPQ